MERPCGVRLGDEPPTVHSNKATKANKTLALFIAATAQYQYRPLQEFEEIIQRGVVVEAAAAVIQYANSPHRHCDTAPIPHPRWATI